MWANTADAKLVWICKRWILYECRTTVYIIYIKIYTDSNAKPWEASWGTGYKQTELVCELWCFPLHKLMWHPQSHHPHKKTPRSWLCCQWNCSMWDTAAVYCMMNHPPLSLCELRHTKCRSSAFPVYLVGKEVNQRVYVVNKVASFERFICLYSGAWRNYTLTAICE